MEIVSSKLEFCRAIGGSEQILALLDLLPDAYVFGKDKDGKFVFANQAIVQALGLRREADLLGHTDFDFFDTDLAERYREEDRLVMTTAEPLLERVWLVPDQDGTLHWYLSNKHPLFDTDGRVIGVAGVMREFDKAGSAVGPYRKLSPVLSFVQEHYRSPIAMADLAACIDVSVSTLERTFKSLFGITPSTYVTRVRLHAAKRALIHSGDTINEIALDCGFYDQSHFTKKFRAAFGSTPSAYREEHRSSLSRDVGGV